MNILIIEDEIPAAKRLKSILKEIDNSYIILDVIESISSAVKWFKENKEPELVFMDIQLSDGLSFEIFNQVDIKCPIIFTTAFDEYAMQAFKVNSIDYLLKPIEIENLHQSLNKLNSLKEQLSLYPSSAEIKELFKNMPLQKTTYKTRFLIKSGNSFVKINSSECAYFYVDNKNTYMIVLEGKRYLLDYTLEELEKQLDPKLYFRASRQYLVGINSITNIHANFNGKLKIIVKPAAEEGIIISRAKAVEFKKWLEG